MWKAEAQESKIRHLKSTIPPEPTPYWKQGTLSLSMEVLCKLHLESSEGGKQGEMGLAMEIGPPEEELLFTWDKGALPPRKRVGEKSRWETWLQENWEDCKNLNISFQDLGDPYQVTNFNRILRRLIRVETLWLVDNSLVDLSAVRLPSCRVLNMDKNHLTSFKQLPKIPHIQRLSLAENHIETLTGLSGLRHTPLESLVLKRNPCEFYQNYRKRVFSCLPNLKVLDGIPKLPEDSPPPETNIFSKLCIAS
ncbi:acidic leucine-rich nuclear phosphoprotein 32-related protein [Desmodus rotundus]|uniref:acidic leucine-rich nuclear phosphoprotein 32-related protein n=1 Tax=Desmodus rotundus TaxID=9430 RepID=UPI0039E48C59